MIAVWLRARSELRSRLGAILALALIVGVTGGVVIAAAAGARRTETAYPRLLQAEQAMDVVVDASGRDNQVMLGALRQAEHLPQVVASSRVAQAQGHLRIPGQKNPGDVFAVVSPDGRFGTSINGVKILQGRMYARDASNEIVPSFAVANELGLRVGESLQFAPGGLFTDQSGGGPKELAPVPMHVVGIGAIPGAFQPLAGGYLPLVLVSPGFYQAHSEYVAQRDLNSAIRLRNGVADVPAFRREVRRISATLPARNRITFAFSQGQQTIGVQETTHAQAIALWVLAGLVAVAGVAIFGQALARQTFLESVEYPTLRALGLSAGQLLAVGLIRAAVIGVIGAGVAAAVGFLLSPLTPTGVAGVAEPHPGFALDVTVVASGAALTALVVTVLGGLPAWRGARARGTALGMAELRGSRSPSMIAGAMSRSPLPPSATAGVRMALEPGRGRTAVPVRTTVLGATLSMLALAAAFTFGASLNRLVTTPGLTGWNWDTVMFADIQNPAQAEAANKGLDDIVGRTPGISQYALGTLFSARVRHQSAFVIATQPVRGSVTPSLIEGRLPQGLDEIALGTETMDKVGTGIGETVPVHTDAGDFQMRVVGRVAVPNFPFTFTRPGEGAAVSLQAADRISPQGPGKGVFARFAPGADQDAILTRLKKKIPGLFILRQQRTTQLTSLNQVGEVPLVLAGIVALMAAATLAHTLVTSIRRRRLDFAILKTLGFVQRQVSATVAWQATVLASIAVLIGIPLGIISGRWGWNVFADRLGVVPAPAIPILAIVLAIPAAIIVANLLAVVPGRIASRLRPGPVLRSE